MPHRKDGKFLSIGVAMALRSVKIMNKELEKEIVASVNDRTVIVAKDTASTGRKMFIPVQWIQ